MTVFLLKTMENYTEKAQRYTERVINMDGQDGK